MRVPATSFQLLEAEEDGYETEGLHLCYGSGWYWENERGQAWAATDAQAADALLERVCVLESEIMDARHKADLGTALMSALAAQQIVDSLDAQASVLDVSDDTACVDPVQNSRIQGARQK